VALLGVLVLLAHGLALAAQALPSFDEVRAGYTSSFGRIVDRQGRPLSELRLDFNGLRTEWVGLHEFSPAMQQALLVAEDKRFFEHGGIDWRAFAAALWQNLWYDHRRGASTLTMQVAGLLEPSLRPMASQGSRRTVAQKWDQALAATELEARWSKAQILEAYLNLAPFRGELQGVGAAAWMLFDKPPASLNRSEAAVLAVMLRGPNASARTIASRACVLLGRIGARGECAAARQLAQQVVVARVHARWQSAPQLAARLLRGPGEVVPTLLDADVQGMVAGLLDPARPGRWSVLVVDNASGDVLADVRRGDGDRPDAARAAPAGPMLLPFLYALGIEGGSLTAASLLQRVAPGAPEPAQGSGLPWTSVRTALHDAAPVAARFALDEVGSGALRERLAALGLEESSTPRAGTVPAARVELSQLAAAYRALAAQGLWSPLRWQAAASPAPRRVFGAPTAFIVAGLLRAAPDEHAAPPASMAAHGTELPGLQWAVAFDARRTVAVRLDTVPARRGADAPAASALDLAREIVLALERAHGGAWFDQPEGVLLARVRFEPAVEAPRLEWFRRGSEMSVSVAPPLRSGISWPREGQLVDARELASDPDFKLWLRAWPARSDVHWRVDGQEIGRGWSVGWRPEGGLAQVELLGADGVVLDRVRFAVRAPIGAGSSSVPR
jgi:penicillin-binding protein 1C